MYASKCCVDNFISIANLSVIFFNVLFIAIVPPLVVAVSIFNYDLLNAVLKDLVPLTTEWPTNICSQNKTNFRNN